MKIIFSCIFQDAGDATRAIRIAEIIRKYSTVNETLDIGFITRGSRFNQAAQDKGFRLIHARHTAVHANFHDEFKTGFGELVGDKSLAKTMLLDEIEIYKQECPDVIVNGFFPISTLARRMVVPQALGISFLPLPLVEAFLHEVDCFPQEIILSKLPNYLQKTLLQHIPFTLKQKNPALRHRKIASAAKELGFTEPIHNVFQMLQSDLYLVNDYAQFYTPSLYPDHVVFTGTLIPEFNHSPITDEHILNILSNENKLPKIFCSLGSVGERQYLFEIIDMFNSEEGLQYSGILLVPKETCSLDEVKARLKNKYVYVTDQFINAKFVNEKSDLVICHGGQGTLQTAIRSGVPIIGVAMQPEQQMNLNHLDQFGAAVHIKRKDWKAKRLLQVVYEMNSNPDYKVKVTALKQTAETENTEKCIGEAFWDKVLNH